MRLRQIVIAAQTLEPAATQLARVFGLGAPYRDPGVATFGLENVVHPIGDQFVEIVAPTEPGTEAGRFIARQGEGGYMLLIQTGDLAGVRARADRLGIRRVWDSDLPEIGASHFHPRDLGGAILSVDQPVPPESWLWGGPDWPSRRGEALVAAATGVTFESVEPGALAGRWGALLDRPVEAAGAGGARIVLDDAVLDYRLAAAGTPDRIAAYRLAVTDAAGIAERSGALGLPADEAALILAGVRFELAQSGVPAGD